MELLHQDWLYEGSASPSLALGPMSNELLVSMELYGRASLLKRIALNALTKHSPTPVPRRFRRIFQDLDVSYTGTLKRNEFHEAFRNTGCSTEEIEDLFQKMDLNCQNEISYTEFMAAVTLSSGSGSGDGGVFLEESRIQETFDLLDEDHSGLISEKNLTKLLGGVDKKEMVVADILQGKAGINYKEFSQMFVQSFVDSRGMDPIGEEKDDYEE